MGLRPLLHRSLVLMHPPVRDRDELFQLFARRAAPLLPGVEPAALVALLRAREEAQSTVLGPGVAFPHAIGPAVTRSLVGAALLEPALPYDAAHAPVDLCFVLFGDPATPSAHVRTLARLARILSWPDTRGRLAAAASARELRARLLEADESAHA